MSKDGLCAVITGSASGLGAATAAILAKGGARIVINYSSSRKEAEETADLCRSAGADVVVVQGDVSRDEDCRKIAAAAAPWGRLDVLVNNAGTTKHVPHENLDGLSSEDFQRLFGVNTIGPFQMVRADAIAAGSGRQGVGPRSFRRQRLVGCGHQRDRLFGRLCRKQGRAEHHHAVTCARAGAADPRQHGMPRLYRYAVVHQGPRRGRRGEGPRFRRRQGAAEAGFHGRGRCKRGLLPRSAAVGQHDRRNRPHRRRCAPHYVEGHSGMVRSDNWYHCASAVHSRAPE